jgi:hypothetical protein
MKILILAIFSDGEDYSEMLKIQRSYLHNFDNVYSYFTMLRENQKNPIEIESDFVYVKGEEAYLNITYKTIEALEYLLNNKQFDYVVRTNMSTIINVPELYKYCSTLPKEKVYTSGNMEKLQWIDEMSGIKDESLWGTVFAHGTSIIMSTDVIKNMIKNKSKIRYDVVDDVAFGIYMTTFLPSAYYEHLPKWFFVSNEIHKDNVDTETIFFRNKSSSDRKQDIRNMEIICNVLYNVKENFQSNYTEGVDIIFYSISAVFVFFIGYTIFRIYNKSRRNVKRRV